MASSSYWVDCILLACEECLCRNSTDMGNLEACGRTTDCRLSRFNKQVLSLISSLLQCQIAARVLFFLILKGKRALPGGISGTSLQVQVREPSKVIPVCFHLSSSPGDLLSWLHGSLPVQHTPDSLLHHPDPMVVARLSAFPVTT